MPLLCHRTLHIDNNLPKGQLLIQTVLLKDDLASETFIDLTAPLDQINQFPADYASEQDQSMYR